MKRGGSVRLIAEPVVRAHVEPVGAASEPQEPRLIPRDRPFFQSSGKVRLGRRDPRFFLWFGANPRDWLNLMLTLPTTAFVFFFMITYSLVILIFAAIYVALDASPDCRISVEGESLTYRGAYAFSVETAATIGYGLPSDAAADTFFGASVRGYGARSYELCALSCPCPASAPLCLPLSLASQSPSPAAIPRLPPSLARYQPRGRAVETCPAQGCVTLPVVVHSQVLTTTFLNAVLVGALFLRLSRGTSKSVQIVFSRKAALRCVGADVVLSFRVCEISFFTYHPMIAPTVHAYAVFHGPSEGPQQALSSEAGADSASTAHSSAADTVTPAAGHGRWPRHVPLYTRAMAVTNPSTEHGGRLFLAVPQLISHRVDAGSPLCPPEPPRSSSPPPTPSTPAATVPAAAAAAPHPPPAQIARYLASSRVEIVVSLDAKDPITGVDFQARHSYVASEVELDVDFPPACVVVADGRPRIDWKRFHELRPTAAGEELNNAA